MSSHTLGAEMVANVHTVFVAVGDTVTPDTEVVLLESMKMEIPVLAEVDGVVREIAVAPGDSIQEGDVIAVIEEVDRDE
ncbi:biotin/lipoyl-binding carrier protein [Jatrophihabitans endophyticus]|uniref:biotin/lipoyl-binding carrier protein n=1 Tax=Jatrophihabitans endophyticus TaxID=1206085 RepID=UPI0019F1F4F2|nr:biotin/lipoyl-binding carrier protein [Jatrophihabitans endophyticus]MBE7190314.1 biotin/lipoyl-binding carrier protein [Jatrophihabitans endophyticus]